MHTLISKALTNIKKSDLHASQKLQSYDYVIFSKTVNHTTYQFFFFKYTKKFLKEKYKMYICALTEHLKWWKIFLKTI